VGFARNAPEGTLERLINAIKGIEVRPDNWAIGSSVVDALKCKRSNYRVLRSWRDASQEAG
jgi:hypothetical protein